MSLRSVWILAAGLLFAPAIALGDNGPFLPYEFPQRIGNFWWGESLASAKSRCSKLLPIPSRTKTHLHFECQAKNGIAYRIAFESKLRTLVLVSHEISDREFAQCERETGELINTGAQFHGDGSRPQWVEGDRSEHDGHEVWSVGFGEFKSKSEFVRLGIMACDRQFEGCKSAGDCVPQVMYIFGPPR